MDKSELIGCRDASFAYEGHIVVSGLNFSVKNGDYLCIVGENGSGKSTLVRGLLRLIRPASGSIKTEDGLKPNEIGYLPQQTASNKDFPASVYEVVLTGRLGQRGVRPFYSRADRTAAEENMARLGISDIKNNCYGELSGGQQQRVLLARALCSAHKLLLLDEPASGLDPIVVQELYAQIAELNRYLSLTIIMVSHDIHSAVKYADHILHLDKKQIFFGTTDDYKKSDIGTRFLN